MTTKRQRRQNQKNFLGYLDRLAILVASTQRVYAPIWCICGDSNSTPSKSQSREEANTALESNGTMTALRNLALVGPPGSGKGSYGKLFAQSLHVPLISVSDILRSMPLSSENNSDEERLASGKLLDDTVVSNAVQNHLLQEVQKDWNATNYGSGGYLLDGYPRTTEQVQLMNDTWQSPPAPHPHHTLQVQAAVHLDVPDFVCQIKMLGRRYCTQCNRTFNVGNVDQDGWVLPPSLPNPEDCERNSTVYCQDTHWMTRPDDTPDVVQHRLEVYHSHVDPILAHFRSQDALLRLTPFRGFDNVPEMTTTLRRWLKQEGKSALH